MSEFHNCTAEQAAEFQRRGFLVVSDAIPSTVLNEIEQRCAKVDNNLDALAFDWAWDAEEGQAERSFRIVQAPLSKLWPSSVTEPYVKWMTRFASALMNAPMEFWYDQYLAKPPGRSVPTYWHQDEGYWGRNLDDKGITCWIPLHDVDALNGCMHFIDGGHRDGLLEHRSVEGVKSDLLTCDVDEERVVVCPLCRGSVTFHHSKMPHMTTANTSGHWRKAVSNHFQAVGTGGEGGHYPWKIYVNQKTGETIIPERG